MGLGFESSDFLGHPFSFAGIVCEEGKVGEDGFRNWMFDPQRRVADRLRSHTAFYDWDRAAGEVRWMTAFDTTEADVDAFVDRIRAELAA